MLAVLAQIRQPVDPDILQPHVEFFRMTGTGLQFRVYASVVALVGLACLAALLVPPRTRGAVRVGGIAALLPAVLPAIVLALPGQHPAFDYAALAALAVTLILLSVTPPVPRLRRNGVARAVLALAVLAVLAGFAASFALTGPVALPGDIYHHHVEMHYAVTVGDAYRAYYDSVPAPSNYGEIMRLFGLAAITAFEALRSEMPEPVSVVRAGQFVAFVLILAAVALAGRPAVSGLAIKLLAASALVVWNFLPDAPGTFFPNQSGLRFLPALALVVWATVAHRGRPAAYKRALARLFPLACGAAIMLNPETVFAVACGGLAAAVLSGYDRERRVLSTAGAGLEYLLLLIVGFAVVAGLSFGADLLALAELTFAFSAGYGGLAAVPSASFLLALFVAFGAVLGAIGRVRQAGGNRRAAWDGLIATAILCWMPYYVNRMHDWNLWFQFALAMILLARRDWRALPRYLTDRRAWPGRAAAVSVTSLLVAQGIFAWQDYRDRRPTGCTDPLVTVGSYCFPRDYARRLAASLDAMTGDGGRETIFVTHRLPMTVIAQGYNRALPYGETFGQVFTGDRARAYGEFLRRYPGPVAIARPAEPDLLYRTDLELLEKHRTRANGGDARWTRYLPRD